MADLPSSDSTKYDDKYVLHEPELGGEANMTQQKEGLQQLSAGGWERGPGPESVKSRGKAVGTPDRVIRARYQIHPIDLL